MRPTINWVVDNAHTVTLNTDQLQRFVQKIPADGFHHFSFVEDFHYAGDEYKLLQFIILLDTLNFGSGYSSEWKEKVQASGYKTIAAAIKNLLKSNPVITADDLEKVTYQDLAKIFNVPEDFTLLPYFTASWNELGYFLNQQYHGDFVGFIESCHHSASQLVHLLAKNLYTFRDIAIYKTREVPFLKKAQCLTADLFLAFKGIGWGQFDDIRLLTSFADNLVPHVLKTEGILTYSKALEQQITNNIKIPSNSFEEVELRATTVKTVEMMKEMLRQQDVLSIQIDWYLWNLGQSSQYKSLPRHRTHTIYY
jgi:hypothetical protein